MTRTIAILCLCLSPIHIQAQEPPPIGHHIMLCQYSPGNKLMELSSDGKLLWEHPISSLCVMFEVLKNGNVIYAYGGKPTGVQEVNREHKVVWNYEAQCEQVLGFSRLPNGNILLGEQGPCQAVEVNRKGKVVKTTPLATDEKGAHRQCRSIHKLKNGNLLACHEGDSTVREYDPSGKVLWEYGGCKNVFEAIRLKNGSTLISTDQRVIEVTPDKRIAWEFNAKDAPDVGLFWATGIQILKNGHLVVANFLSGHAGQGAHAFEVTRGKKVVWKYANHTLHTLVTMVHYLDD